MRWRKTYYIRIGFYIFIASIIASYYVFPLFRTPKITRQNSPTGHTDPRKTFQKEIVIFTTNGRPWEHCSQKQLDGYSATCSDKCRVSYDRRRIRLAHAVVFSRSNPDFVFEKYKKEKASFQRWVMFETEAPFKIQRRGNFSRVRQNFYNLTISYKRASDIYLPYGFYVKTQQTRQKVVYEKIWRQKTGNALWLVSNCNPIMRKRVATRLSKYIQLDISGSCLKTFKSVRSKKVKVTSKKEISRYKFYLAFENGFCEEYISDKYWMNAIAYQSIPVVLGGADYEKSAIPGSYIDAVKFEDIKSLGEYLNEVANNKTLYLSYFKWKEKYTYKPTSKEGWPHASKWLCELCNLINKNQTTKEIDNQTIEKFNEQIIEKVIEQTRKKINNQTNEKVNELTMEKVNEQTMEKVNDQTTEKVIDLDEFWSHEKDCVGRDKQAKALLFREMFRNGKQRKNL